MIKLRNRFNKIYAYIKKNFSFKEFIINLLIIGITLFLCLYNFPYVIYKPGGTINLNNRILIDNESVDVGNYNMAYVSVSRGNLPTIIASWLIRDWDLKKEKEITITNTDYETTFKIEQVEMLNSIDIAKIVAFKKAEKDITITPKENIIYVVDKQANTDLLPLDEIISYDNIEFTNVAVLKEYINSLNVGDKITINVISDGKEVQKYAYIYEEDGTKLLGIAVYTTYDIITNPEVSISSKTSEAGSSGGLMLTLAIYDSIVEEDLAKNKVIVGTGTINIDGTVGAIGGVKYKMLGANKAKADVFFVPEDNYEEAKAIYDKYNFSFDLVMVKTFDDAISYLSSN